MYTTRGGNGSHRGSPAERATAPSASSAVTADAAAAIAADARARLEAMADPAVKAGGERYFKGVIPFIGVKAPRVRDVARALYTDHGTLPTDTLVDAALALLRAPHMEEKQLAVLLLERIKRRWPSSLLARLESVFDEAVDDWATCDGIAGRVLHPLMARDVTCIARVAAWSRAANPWRQRAAAVAFVKSARHGAHTEVVLTICARLVQRPDRFVQLGMGWVLRELSLADRAATLAFLREHLAQVRREALRYAIEKMPAREQAAILAEHAGASVPRGRPQR